MLNVCISIKLCLVKKSLKENDKKKYRGNLKHLLLLIEKKNEKKSKNCYRCWMIMFRDSSYKVGGNGVYSRIWECGKHFKIEIVHQQSQAHFFIFSKNNK